MNLFAAKTGGAENAASVVMSERTVPVPLIIAVVGVFLAVVGVVTVLLRRR